MLRLLVATDFSTRSDRALRRACILAKQLPARLVLVHAVDSDRPAVLVDAERQAASVLLDGVRRALSEVDGLDCETLLTQGEASSALAEAVERTAADLVVLGPHRRDVLRDVFVGTTAERTIRAARGPVLMCNAVPVGAYRRVVVGIDGSEASAHALRVLGKLGVARGAAVSGTHVFDAPAAHLRLRAPGQSAEIAESVGEERARASRALSAFFDAHGLAPLPMDLLLNEGSADRMLHAAARDCGADLLVLGTHGRSGLRRRMLGSVAEAVLRGATVDVLAVPVPAETGP